MMKREVREKQNETEKNQQKTKKQIFRRCDDWNCQSLI